jgi:hypothetical protein
VDEGGALVDSKIEPAVREICSDCSIFAFIIKASWLPPAKSPATAVGLSILIFLLSVPDTSE